MEQIKINFLSKKGELRSVRRYMPYIFIVVSVYSAYSIYSYYSNYEKLEKYRNRLSELQSLTTKRAVVKVAQAASQKDKEELAQKVDLINGIIITKSFSWTGLLTELEARTPGNITVVQISPDFKSKKIQISGVAPTANDALSYVDLLTKSGSFSEVFLLKHAAKAKKTSQSVEAEGPRVVLFNISAVYSPKEEL